MTLKSVEELFRKRHAELKDQPEFWKKCEEKVKRIELGRLPKIRHFS